MTLNKFAVIACQAIRVEDKSLWKIMLEDSNCDHRAIDVQHISEVSISFFMKWNSGKKVVIIEEMVRIRLFIKILKF